MTRKTAGSTGQPPSEASADHVFAEKGAQVPESLAEGPGAVTTEPTQDRPGGSDEEAARSDELSRQLADAELRVLRAQADLENYRKRVRREMDEDRRYAALPLIRDLLPAIDNLGRAMSAFGDGTAAAAYRPGIEMVAQQLLQVLAQHHCHPMDPLNEPFDPTWHEAIGRQPTSDAPPGTVLKVEQTGYRLHDRVIRPAYVIVASAAHEE